MSRKTQSTTEPKVSEAMRARANSKLCYQAQFLNRLIDSIQEFHADASEEARVEATPDLKEAHRKLTAFLTE